MKRIIPFSLCLLLIIPAASSANNLSSTSAKTEDTSSNMISSSMRLTLSGSLSAFHANYGKNYFELNWNTVAGNFDHFDIERSFDGIHYEKMGSVNQSAAQATGQFSFRDGFRTVTGLDNDFFYRLKEVEVNGNIIYSKVLIARMFNTRSLASLSVTPDPLANDILVNVQLKEESYVVMKVSDEKGNLILKEGQKAANGANTYTLEGTRNLHPGMYTLEVTVNSKERMVMKLAKG
jgi:hypothetical protein